MYSIVPYKYLTKLSHFISQFLLLRNVVFLILYVSSSFVLFNFDA